MQESRCPEERQEKLEERTEEDSQQHKAEREESRKSSHSRYTFSLIKQGKFCRQQC